MLEVAVVGGGPVGNRLAFKLAEMGHRVAVFEKRSSIGQKLCCTGIISRECVERFWVPSHVILRQVNSATVVSPSGNSMRIYHPETQACIIDRSAFDKELATQAQSSGAEYNLDCKVENISFHPDKVVLEIKNSLASRKLEAKAVVVTNGFNPVLVKRIGLKPLSDFVAGAQVEVRLNGTEEIEVYLSQKLAPGFFCWLVPTSQGRGLAGLLSRRTPGIKLREWISELESCGRINPHKYDVRYGGIPLKPLSRTYGNRFLVVGDAAGQVKPTTGGGIYFGLLCADMAADSLHKALQCNNLSAKSLSGYEHAWKYKLGQELQREYFIRCIYERLSDKQIERLFLKLKSSGLADSMLQESKISFDWHGSLLVKAVRFSASHQIRKLLHFQQNRG